MIAVSPAAGIVVIDVIATETGRQAGVVAERRAGLQTAAARAAFVSSSLHRSLEGLRVATYSQWRTPEAANNANGFAYDVVHVQKAGSTNPVIVAGAAPLTLIVVMTCGPAEQDELVTYLIGTAIEHSENPGFVSCTIHRGLEGTRVAEYIQWESKAVLGAMLAKPASQAHLARVKSRSSSALYEVVATVESATERV